MGDVVSMAKSESGGQIIENKSAGYYFSKPEGWFLEKNTGSDVILYPGYSPEDVSADGDGANADVASSTPACKIEISTLLGKGGAMADGVVSDLDAFVTSNLHADPTAEILEASRSPMVIGSAGLSTSSALEWRGSLNGVSTTLVYASANANASSGKVVEFAPIAANGTGDSDGDDCELMLRDLLAGFHFGNYGNDGK
jgi:hypothetical protein